MDLHWQEEQRAFQARVLIDDTPLVALRPYRTFVGAASPHEERTVTRTERVTLAIIIGTVVVLLLLSFGVARDLAALTASFTGGVALMAALSPGSPPSRLGWTPLLAVYSPNVTRGDRPICVTEIGVDEFDRLGAEGFGTVVGTPRPGTTFGLFVDDHLVWPRTPPRRPIGSDPDSGAD